MLNWKTRLAEARKAKGLNKTEFARAVGVSNATVTDWEKAAEDGGVQEIKGANLTRICSVLGVTAEWLLYGNGVAQTLAPYNVAETGDRRRSPTLAGRRLSDDVEIPQYVGVGGGMGRGVLLRDQPGAIHGWLVTPEWINKNVKNFTSAENLRIVTGFGDSMQPLYNPGDPLLVDIGVRTVEFDSVYFFRIGDEGFIKRLQRVPGQGLVAISDNKNYRDWTISADMDFEVFARVIKGWRGSDF